MYIFRQLFEEDTSTYTYLMGDPDSKEAVLVDPVISEVEKYTRLIEELGLTLKYTLDTHVHADHITAASKLKELTGSQTVVSALAGVSCSDISVNEGDTIRVGALEIKVFTTPGHTNGCLSFYMEDRVLTGDALLIGGTGRTDFQEGDANVLFDSISKKLFTLPDDTLIFPGHDYNGIRVSTIAQEKTNNPRVGQGKSRADFIQIMENLNLPYPRYIDQALPVNLVCGKQ